MGGPETQRTMNPRVEKTKLQDARALTLEEHPKVMASILRMGKSFAEESHTVSRW